MIVCWRFVDVLRHLAGIGLHPAKKAVLVLTIVPMMILIITNENVAILL